MEETRTRFCAAMPASRSASSNEVRRSLCWPTPLSRKMRLGSMLNPNVIALQKNGLNRMSKNNTCRRNAGEKSGRLNKKKTKRQDSRVAVRSPAGRHAARVGALQLDGNLDKRQCCA